MLLSICQESNKYAVSRGHSLQVDVAELKTFIGILLVNGYVQLPRRRMLWLASDDCHNAVVTNCMTRNRFDEIFSFFHVADNNALDMQDKFSKMRPLVDGMNRQSLNNFLPEQTLSIDEFIVPYFDKHGTKQYIRGKPIKYGYKMWVIATPGGYAIQFYLYQGAGTGDNAL